MVLRTRHWDRLGNGGLTFTELGFGTAPLGNLYKAISDDDARATLDAAWEGGVRYFDTAPLYGLGLSETRLNPFLRDKPRESYILSTKVGRLIEYCSPEHRAGVLMTALCVRLNIHFHVLVLTKSTFSMFMTFVLFLMGPKRPRICALKSSLAVVDMTQ